MSVTKSWDAGDMGCGELIIELKKRISTLAPGELIEVRATDKGAIEDLPAWARLTGNELLNFNHPTYTFKKK